MQAEQAALIQPKLVNDSSLSGPDLKVLPIVQLTIWETTILGYKSTKFVNSASVLSLTLDLKCPCGLSPSLLDPDWYSCQLTRDGASSRGQ